MPKNAKNRRFLHKIPRKNQKTAPKITKNTLNRPRKVEDTCFEGRKTRILKLISRVFVLHPKVHRGDTEKRAFSPFRPRYFPPIFGKIAPKNGRYTH